MTQVFIELLGRQPDALLFDLDGTLVDSVPDIAVALDAMLVAQGFAAAGADKVRQWVGNGALKLVERSLAFSLNCSEREVDREVLRVAHQCFLGHYKTSNGLHSQLYPGVIEALQIWYQQAMPMAIVTNKPIQFVPYLLTSLGIADYFSVCLGGECVANKKPNPAMLLAACQQLQVEPDQCVMVGDSRNDIAAAQAAGMVVVAVDYGYNHGQAVALERPSRVISNLCELLA